MAFVIYGPKGFEESGGFPYRLVFDTQDTAAITSIVGGLATKNRTESLVYGQEIDYGPVAPANVGELRSPACQLRTQFKFEHTIIDTIYGQKFDGIPKISKDSAECMGISKMDKSFYRNVQNTLVLPCLLLLITDTGFSQLEQNAYRSLTRFSIDACREGVPSLTSLAILSKSMLLH